MPRNLTPVHVWFDHTPDNAPEEVTIDQRDIAKWEVQPFRDESRNHTRMRFCTWSAMTRTGQYFDPFDKFNADCVSVENVPEPDEDQEDEESLDPGSRPTFATS